MTGKDLEPRDLEPDVQFPWFALADGALSDIDASSALSNVLPVDFD
jgi:hypothetical protein